jgi:hypothetical protein
MLLAIINYLSVYVTQAAKDIQSRPLQRPDYVLAYTPVPP